MPRTITSVVRFHHEQFGFHNCLTNPIPEMECTKKHQQGFISNDEGFKSMEREDELLVPLEIWFQWGSVKHEKSFLQEKCILELQ